MAGVVSNLLRSNHLFASGAANFEIMGMVGRVPQGIQVTSLKKCCYTVQNMQFCVYCVLRTAELEATNLL